jgi:hypothetical protein
VIAAGASCRYQLQTTKRSAHLWFDPTQLM